jgi:uncharacterized membrane protein
MMSGVNLTFGKVMKSIYYLSMVYFSYLMVLITWQYIPIKIEAAFLNVKHEISTYFHYQLAFFCHVYTSILVLICGITQFSVTIRSRFPSIHRILGKAYIFLVLFVASPSGLVMAYYANGGIWSRVSFAIQAFLWFIFTAQAFRYARRKDWADHRAFMMRSYALTLSAVSLRLFKWMIVSIFQLPPMDTYKIVSWLGWLVNIALVEIYLMYEKTKSSHNVDRSETLY